jgi:hypothetical protein
VNAPSDPVLLRRAFYTSILTFNLSSRTTDDYEAMAAVGILGVVEPAFWQGQPRTHVGAFINYFNSLIGWRGKPLTLGGIESPSRNFIV